MSPLLGAGQMTVKGAARRGPGLANPLLVTPTSSVEAPGDVGRRAHTHLRIVVESQLAGAPITAPTPKAGPPYPGYLVETPASLACIYKLVATTPGCIPDAVTSVATGGSRMIALVDAYDLPTAAADLQTFSTQFGLPPANLKVVYASGTQPGVDPGWALEEALDIEMAHAMAPNAAITLVEAASSSNDDLGVAIDTAYNLVAAAGGGQVSMSFGGSEYADETSFDAHFARQTSPITFYASTGDSAGTSYPSTSPNVVAVGGTAISRETLLYQSYGTFLQETAWADAGSGLSSVFARPSYQHALARTFYYANARAVPDVSAVASSYTPVWIYCGAACGAAGWYTVYGTSVASPLVAGMANHWGQFHLGSQSALASLYAVSGTAAFFNVSMGVCGPSAELFRRARLRSLHRPRRAALGQGVLSEPVKVSSTITLYDQTHPSNPAGARDDDRRAKDESIAPRARPARA